MDDSACNRPGARDTLKICAAIAVAAVAALSAVTLAASTETKSSAFAAENAVAMAKMMSRMHVPPSGVIDRDFATMMIAHHEGAIDMALAELRYGRDDKLRRIAQGIVVAQQQEIAAMRLALNQPLPAAAAICATRTGTATLERP